jgi:hypothetical protein
LSEREKAERKINHFGNIKFKSPTRRRRFSGRTVFLFFSFLLFAKDELPLGKIVAKRMVPQRGGGRINRGFFTNISLPNE